MRWLPRTIGVVAGALALVSCAEAQQRPAITGIAFMRMYASDPVASEAFYRMLGFAESSVAPGVQRYRVNSSQWLETVPLPSPPPASRQAAVGFTTADAQQLEAYFRAHGVTVVEPLVAGRFMVLDPEGNHVVFVQSALQPIKNAHAAAGLVPTSHRIIHAGYMVHSATAEDHFYRELLGFKPYWRGGSTDASTDYVSLQVPDGKDWIEYMLNDQPSPDPGKRLQQLGGMDHVSLGVTHMQFAKDALAQNGCGATAYAAQCTRMQMGRDGKIQMNLFDPDGTRLEYMEFAPSGQVCCSTFTGPHPGDTDPENRP